MLGAEVTSQPILMQDGGIRHLAFADDGAPWIMSDPFDTAMHRRTRTGSTRSRSISPSTGRVGAAGAPDRGPQGSPPAGHVSVFHGPLGLRWLPTQPQNER